MNSKLKEEILINLKSNELFIESITFFKTTNISILKKIITDKLVGNKLMFIINKIDNKVDSNTALDKLNDNDLLFLNDFYSDLKYIKLIKILFELKEKYKEIDNYVRIINYIYNIISFSVTIIFVYLIIDMYVINKEKTDIDYYLYSGVNVISNVLLLLTIISFSEVLILLLSNVIAILGFLPPSVWIALTKIILIKLLLNYKFIFEKLGEEQGKIIFVVLIVFILIINFYNIYMKHYANENYITLTNFVAFLFNKYIRPNMEYFDFIYKTFDKQLG